MAKCSSCGASIENGRCPYCGTSYKHHNNYNNDTVIVPKVVYHETYEVNTPTVSPKSKICAFLLCFFFGIFGIHYFYVGKIGMGILYFFTYGLFGIGWIVDAIRILIGTFKDKNGLCLV